MRQNKYLITLLLMVVGISGVLTLTNPVIAEVTIDVGNLLWDSDTAFFGTLDHAITANRTWTFPDLTGEVLVTASPTTGDIIYYDGTDWVELAIGSNDQVLKIASSLPSWGTDSGGTSTGVSLSTQVEVNNDSGATLDRGDPVYITGFDAPSSLPTVDLADNDDTAKMPALGLINGTIANGANGFVTIAGEVRGSGSDPFDTDGSPFSETWTIGDSIYIDANVGELTNVKPTSYSEQIQKIGQVTRVHNTQGIIEISGAGRSNDIPATVGLDSDYVIKTDGSLYTAFDKNFAIVSSNADLDTVWTAVKAHTDYVNNESIHIQFGTGEFILTNGFDINRSNLTLAGNGMGVTWLVADTDNPTTTPVIDIGSDPTSTKRNIGDVTVDAISVTTDTTTHADDFDACAGTNDCWAMIESEELIGFSDYMFNGELQRVNASDGTTGIVTLQGRILDSYPTVSATSPTIRLIDTMLEAITLKDFSVKNLKPLGSETTNTEGIRIKWVENWTIDSVEVTEVFYSGIRAFSSVHGKISDCYVHNVKVTANLSYGIAIYGAHQGITVQGCNFEHVRYGVTVNNSIDPNNGKTRNVLIDGNTIFHPNQGGIDSHSGVDGLVISNNQITGRSEKQTLISTDATVTNGIQARSPSTIIGNHIINIDNHGIRSFQEDCSGTENCNVSQHAREMVVVGNHIEGGAGSGIILENTTNGIISDNLILNMGSAGISLTSDGYEIDNEEYVSIISNNIIRDSAPGTVAISSDHRTDIIGNTVTDSGGGSGIIWLLSFTGRDGDISRSRVIDNHIEGGVGASADAIRIQGGNFVQVNGNYMYNVPDQCISAQTNVDIDGSNSTYIGNVCINADYPTGTGIAFYFEDLVGSYFADNYIQNNTNINGALRIASDADDNILMNNVFVDVVKGIELISGSNTCVNNYNIDGTLEDNGDTTCPT